MYVRPIFVFKTHFYEPSYCEFKSFISLKNFLKNFDFMHPHEVSRLSTGLPVFQLGVKYECFLEGYVFRSDVKWISAFLCGRYCRKDQNGKMFVSVPFDKVINNTNSEIVYREYKEIPFHKNMADAVINIDKMRQVWPKNYTTSEMKKFLASVEKIKRKIRRTRVH